MQYPLLQRLGVGLLGQAFNDVAQQHVARVIVGRLRTRCKRGLALANQAQQLRGLLDAEPTGYPG